MTATQQSNFNVIVNLLNHQPLLHKMYDSKYGWAYITDATMKRHRIDFNTPVTEVRRLIKQVNEINRNHNYTVRWNSKY